MARAKWHAVGETLLFLIWDLLAKDVGLSGAGDRAFKRLIFRRAAEKSIKLRQNELTTLRENQVIGLDFFKGDFGERLF